MPTKATGLWLDEEPEPAGLSFSSFPTLLQTPLLLALEREAVVTGNFLTHFLCSVIFFVLVSLLDHEKNTRVYVCSLGTDLYINLRACQGTYVRDDLLADLRMTTTMADGPEPLLANSLALDDDDDDNGDNEDGTSDAGSGGTGNTNNKNENSADETMASAIV